MEHKLGEKFDYDGITLKVVKDKGSGCEGCYFRVNESSCSYSVRDVVGPCGECKRSDGNGVIFKGMKGKKTIRNTNAEYKRNETKNYD